MYIEDPLNFVNESLFCPFLPYYNYNKVGQMAGRLYERKSEKSSEQTQDQQKIPADIISRKDTPAK